MNKKVKVASFVIGSVVCFSCLATTICSFFSVHGLPLLPETTPEPSVQ